MADDLTDTIEKNAQRPKEAEADHIRSVQHDLTQQIEADRYLKGQAAVSGGKSAWGATRPARLVPPGTGDPAASESDQ